METRQIDDTSLLHHIQDSRFKSESLSLHFYVNTIPENNAALYLLMQVLKDGCRRYPDEYSLTRKLNSLYGADITHKISRIGSITEVVISIDSIDERFCEEKGNFREAVKLLFDIVYDPYLIQGDFSDLYLTLEKNLLLRELDDLYHRKDEYARLLAKNMICDVGVFGHPLYGKRNEISKLKTSDLMRAYMRLLDAELHIFYNGAKSVQDVEDIIPKNMIANSMTAETDLYYPLHIYHHGKRYLSKHIRARQSHVVLGYATNVLPRKALYQCLPIFRQLLSDSSVSKLFRNVREKTSICYTCQAFFEPTLGLMYLYAGVEPGQERLAARLMQGAIKDLRDGNITDEEFSAAKRAAISHTRVIGDRRESYELWVARQMITGLPSDIEAQCEMLERISVKELVAFAGELIPVSHVTLIGEESSVE